MITEKDLQEAIAECEGQRNPNANTCIKLAAFYTIKQHMFGEESPGAYSFATGPQPGYEKSVEDPGEITYESGTEFAKEIYGMKVETLMPIMDELMSTLEVVQPRLYAGVMRKVKSPV